MLGCQPVWGDDGHLRGALGRRVGAARERIGDGEARVIVSGGRTWGGMVEADAMRDELLRRGLPAASVTRERCSLTTRDNARLTALLLRRFEVDRLILVTCEWHVPRAAALFRREGLGVDVVPVAAPAIAPARRWVRAGREWVSARLDVARGALP